ncbi:MAG: DUF2157 domain-containing protein [Maricaulaceae bacterium]
MDRTRLPQRRLEAALERWTAEGWVSPQAANAIRADQARAVPANATGVSLAAALLISVAALTLIAANWADAPRLVRFVVIVALQVGALLGAAWSLDRGRPALGDGLTLIAIAFFGGGLALVGQTFNIGGTFDGLIRVWTLGALAIAIVLRNGLGAGAAIALGAAWAISSIYAGGAGGGTTPAVVAHLSFALVAVAGGAIIRWRRSTLGLVLAVASAAAVLAHSLREALDALTLAAAVIAVGGYWAARSGSWGGRIVCAVSFAVASAAYALWIHEISAGVPATLVGLGAGLAAYVLGVLHDRWEMTALGGLGALGYGAALFFGMSGSLTASAAALGLAGLAMAYGARRIGRSTSAPAYGAAP